MTYQLGWKGKRKRDGRRRHTSNWRWETKGTVRRRAQGRTHQYAVRIVWICTGTDRHVSRLCSRNDEDAHVDYPKIVDTEQIAMWRMEARTSRIEPVSVSAMKIPQIYSNLCAEIVAEYVSTFDWSHFPIPVSSSTNSLGTWMMESILLPDAHIWARALWTTTPYFEPSRTIFVPLTIRRVFVIYGQHGNLIYSQGQYLYLSKPDGTD